MKFCVSLALLALAAGVSFGKPKETVNEISSNGWHDTSFLEEFPDFRNRKFIARQDPPEVPMHAYPHQISVQIINGNSGEWGHFCGGAILEGHWVLTTAVCAQVCERKECRLVAGAHNISAPELTQQVRQVNRAVIHPKYNRRDYNYGLLFTDTEWKFNKTVQPIILPISSKYPTGNCVASGWGTGDVLRHLNMTILSYDECKAIYCNYFTERMICTTYGPVEGDVQKLGAPMVCDGELAGMSSWRDPPPGTQENFAVFSNVAAENDWFHNSWGY